MNSIVCLCKSTPSAYRELIQRNISISKTINKEGIHPLIVFHENNISDKDQSFIRKQTPNQNIEFVDISSSWGGHGYTSMCQFFYYDIWNYCKDYDNILRVDTDCIIRRSDYDIFEYSDSCVFVSPYLWGESHKPTCESLPGVIEDFTGVNRDIFWGNKFPFWVIGSTKPSFWLKEPVQNILKKIVSHDRAVCDRWGDLPVLGSLVNIYSESENLKFFRGLQFYHGSHNKEFTSEDLLT